MKYIGFLLQGLFPHSILQCKDMRSWKLLCTTEIWNFRANIPSGRPLFCGRLEPILPIPRFLYCMCKLRWLYNTKCHLGIHGKMYDILLKTPFSAPRPAGSQLPGRCRVNKNTCFPRDLGIFYGRLQVIIQRQKICKHCGCRTIDSVNNCTYLGVCTYNIGTHMIAYR